MQNNDTIVVVCKAQVKCRGLEWVGVLHYYEGGENGGETGREGYYFGSVGCYGNKLR